MTEIERIAEQLRCAYEKDAWHGPSVKELVSDLSAQQAMAKPIVGFHSIWEIVLHISAWTVAIQRRIKGELVKEPTEGDWPPVKDPTPQNWQKTLEELERRNFSLQKAISELTDNQLETKTASGGSSYYINLHGLIQHHLYHAGQIAVLKKAISQGK